eukprot:gb/GEZN01001713.1/.p1 GENE.gb/GEZN01001713.1/~~gb/GEZN01001713.1/.p1  ORF type:complete len:906 (-),score=166.18 gb/GEZN01001713.1/:148-2805(-)
MSKTPNFRAHASNRYRASIIERPLQEFTQGSREKLALMTSPAELKLAAETACIHCKLDLRQTVICAALEPLDGRNVSTYLNLSPRYQLTGHYICGTCMVARNEWGIFLTFTPVYQRHTPDFQEWLLMRLYYPEERNHGNGKVSMLPGTGKQTFQRKHLDIYYSILGYSAQRMCTSRLAAGEQGPLVLSAFCHLWHTARRQIATICRDDELPASENDMKLVAPLTQYTDSMAQSLINQAEFKKVEQLETKLDPRVLVFIQHSAALTGQQNRQLAPLFLSRASSLVTQTLFPSERSPPAAPLQDVLSGVAQTFGFRARNGPAMLPVLAPISVEVVRGHILRDFLTRAVRHFSALSFRGFEQREELARHVLCAFGKRALDQLRAVTLLLDLTEKYQFGFRQEFVTSKSTLGFLGALHDSLADVTDLRTMLCMNGEWGHLSDLDLAELLLEACELKDGETVSAESLDLGPLAAKRYLNLDRIIATNVRARKEQQELEESMKQKLEAKKQEAAEEKKKEEEEKNKAEEKEKQAKRKAEEAEKEEWVEVGDPAGEGNTGEKEGEKSARGRKGEEKAIEGEKEAQGVGKSAREGVGVQEGKVEEAEDQRHSIAYQVHKAEVLPSLLPPIVQEYHRMLREEAHAFTLGMHKKRLTLLQVFLDDSSSTPFEGVLLMRSMSSHVSSRTFLKLVWRMGDPKSNVWLFFESWRPQANDERSVAPRKFHKWGIKIKGTEGRKADMNRYSIRCNKNKQLIAGGRAGKRAIRVAEEKAESKLETMREVEEEEELLLQEPDEALQYLSPQEAMSLAQRKRGELAKIERQLREEAESECPICFGHLETLQYYSLPCSTASAPHSFCGACLSAVAKAEPVCPLCRTAFSLQRLKLLGKILPTD